MSDYASVLVDACLAALGTSTVLPALMGRANGAGTGATAPWCVPWNDRALDTACPIYAYQRIDDATWGATYSRSMRIRLTAFAPDPATADAMIGEAIAMLTPQKLYAGGADACLDPKSPPRRAWPPHAPAADDPAQYRADVMLALYITPA